MSYNTSEKTTRPMHLQEEAALMAAGVKIVNLASGRRIWARKGDFETHGNYEVRAFGACAPEQHVFPDQLWRFEVVREGVFMIVNAESNRRLWARPGCAEEGVSCHNPVGFGACGHDGVFPDQYWRIEKLEGNVYKIVNDQSGRRVFARSGEKAERGFGACAPEAPESAEQHWRLEPDPFAKGGVSTPPSGTWKGTFTSLHVGTHDKTQEYVFHPDGRIEDDFPIEDDWRILADAFLQNTSLVEVTFSGHAAIGRLGLPLLVDVWARGALPQLTRLTLCDAQIDDVGFTSLADACAKGGLPRLQELDVRKNKIGDVGLASLADACIKGSLPQLRELLVVFNHVTIHGFNALTDAMSKGKLTELKHLHVHCNGLESSHYRELLDQVGYSLTPADRYALATAMSDFGCTVELVCDFNPFIRGNKVRVVAGEEDVAAVYSMTDSVFTEFNAGGDLRAAITGVVPKSHRLHAPVAALAEALLLMDGAHPEQQRCRES